MNQSKLKIAWFSPFVYSKTETNDSSQSAYFTETLLPFLGKKAEIHLYHNSFSSHPEVPTFHYLRAMGKRDREEYDFFIYNIEDNQCCDFSRIHAGLYPGVSIFHNLFFENPIPDPYLDSPWRETLDKLLDSSIAWARREEKRRDWPANLQRECSLSYASVFTSSFYRGEYERLITRGVCPGGSPGASYFLPYPVDFSSLKKSSQKKLIDRDSPFTIGFCGTTKIEHRLHKLLEALSLSKRQVSLVCLIDKNELERAANMCKEFGIKNVELISDSSIYAWQTQLPRIDLAFHLAFSVYSNPGAKLALSLSHGVPSVVNDHAPFDFFPEDIVSKVLPGPKEAKQIAELLNSFESSKQKGNKLYNFSSELYSAEAISEQLIEVLNRSSIVKKEVLKNWECLERQAKSALMEETLTYIPKESSYYRKHKEIFSELGWS